MSRDAPPRSDVRAGPRGPLRFCAPLAYLRRAPRPRRPRGRSDDRQERVDEMSALEMRGGPEVPEVELLVIATVGD
ncbi:MAG: hypothetical protein ACRELC_07855, partial [Gemmatimonadota bacterium]